MCISRKRNKCWHFLEFIEWVWVYLCFTSHATIFQSYVWRHRCAGGLKKKLYPLPINDIIYRPKLYFILQSLLWVIEFTLLNVLILKLNVYCGPDKFYERSKLGQNDKEKNRAPLESQCHSLRSCMSLTLLLFIYQYTRIIQKVLLWTAFHTQEQCMLDWFCA